MAQYHTPIQAKEDKTQFTRADTTLKIEGRAKRASAVRTATRRARVSLAVVVTIDVRSIEV